MLESQRHKRIVSLVEQYACMSVRDLSRALKCSEATIRRDIVKLDGQGALKKIHGGAEHLSPVKNAPRLNSASFIHEKERHSREKLAIARYAVTLCEENDSIIINGGSSTYCMAKFLPKRGLNVLTNSIALASVLMETTENRVTLPGGEIYREQNLVLSAFNNDTIAQYHGTKMFMGTPGIGEFGVMESDPLLVRAELKLLQQADKLIVLADSSKIGRRSNLITCSLSDVDMLITDAGAKEKDLSLFAESNVDVVIV